MAHIRIANRLIGPDQPVFVIAEAGVNHNGDMALAKRLIDEAVTAKADAVKFQSFRVNRLLTKSAPKAQYQAVATGAEETQYAMLKKLELSEADHLLLQSYCRDRGVIFLSTPFEEESADYLASIDVPAFKIPSGEVTNTPFLAHVARIGKPIILSTGMSTLKEVSDAVRALYEAGNRDVALLHCLSSYPANPAEVNLRAMDTMRRNFDCPIGYSDHTLGLSVSLAAVALGATVIEKHFTLDKTFDGPDHKASLDPAELRDLIRGIRIIEASLGDGEKRLQASERNTADVARKSIVVVREIKAGECIERDAVAIKRPGTGLPPAQLQQIIGRVAARFIAADHVLSVDDLA